MARLYPAGHLLCVDYWAYEHVGISDGKGRVFENSNDRHGRGLVTLEEFSSGKGIIDVGVLPGSIPVSEMMARAASLVSNFKSYHVLMNNCEHFVREVCGVEIESPQIQQALLAAFGLVLAAQPMTAKARGVIAGASVGALLTKNGENAIIKSILGASLGLLVGAVLSPEEDLVTFMRSSPLSNVDDEFDRDKELPRGSE
jgi:hypothetical protein